MIHSPIFTSKKLEEVKDRSSMIAATQQHGQNCLVYDGMVYFSKERTYGYAQHFNRSLKIKNGVMIIANTNKDWLYVNYSDGEITYTNLDGDESGDSIADKIARISDATSEWYVITEKNSDFAEELSSICPDRVKYFSPDLDKIELFQFVTSELALRKINALPKWVTPLILCILVGIAGYILYGGGEEEVMPIITKKVDPYANFKRVVTGQLPSAREALYHLYDVVKYPKGLKQWKMSSVILTPEKDGKTVFQLMLDPINKDSNPSVVMLSNDIKASVFNLDVLSGKPQLFTRFKNYGPYVDNETQGKPYLYIAEPAEKGVAYLQDALNILFKNVKVEISPESKDEKVYKSIEFTVKFESGDAILIDRLQAVFAGWPVLLKTAKLDRSQTDETGNTFDGSMTLEFIGG